MARWLTRPDHPLTARVLVNRLWQHHFGVGIVATANDFGVHGSPPSNPELLDWLAVEFVAPTKPTDGNPWASGAWSIKRMHKLMVLSAAYQQSSHAAKETLQKDPDNALFSRANRQRLEGEIVRDSLLEISGRLNPKMGGQGVFPPVPVEATKGTISPWVASKDPDDHVRRSIYIFARRNLRFPFLESFDLPDSNQSCPKRDKSVTAPQALALLNATDVVAAAKATADRVAQEKKKHDERIQQAYRLILGRPPNADETRLANEFLRQAPLSELCRALFNVNEFCLSGLTSPRTAVRGCRKPWPVMTPYQVNRRDFLARAGGGFGMIALTALLQEQGLLAAEDSASVNPVAPRKPHVPASAKQVIFLFMSGGPSQVDTFDPKPELTRLQGQPLPASFGKVKTRRGVDRNRLLASRRTFTRHGQAGIEVSDLFPHLAQCVDDLCVIRSCHGDSVTHPESVYLMNTGSILMGRPSLGAWVSYGLGTENQNMPAYIVLPDPNGWVKGGAPAWGNGYMPASYQGTVFRGGASPLLNLKTPPGIDDNQQRRTLDLIGQLNGRHFEERSEDTQLSARIAAYELAYRMQSHATEVVDISRESAATRTLYGLDGKETAEFGTRCLLARRLVERGVRFVQVYCGDTNGWDGHSNLEENHGKLALQSDRPIAGLLRDLKARGLLDSTLVIWGGEFGRTPMSEGSNGRDHNPYGFTMWLAGGGVKGGQVIGATDPVGLRAVEEPCHVHDFHATVLHLLGLNHLRLTYQHNGRRERLTDVSGELIEKVWG